MKATDKGVEQGFIENATLAFQVPIDCRFDDPVDAARAAAFDLLNGHIDRHAGSWVLNDQGKISLIDNSFTFPTNNDELRSEFVDRAINENWAIPRQVKDWVKSWPKVENHLTEGGYTPEQIAGAKARLDALGNAATFKDIEKIYNSTREGGAPRRVASSGDSGDADGLTNWSWREGVVEVEEEHIELRYGDAAESNYEQWLPIALIGKPTNHVFPVLWLMSSENAAREPMIGAARKELDFYLVEHPKEFPGTGHPWEYAIYHCTTGGNMYSSVHWSYFPNGNPGQRISSRVIQLAGGNKAIFKPAFS